LISTSNFPDHALARQRKSSLKFQESAVMRSKLTSVNALIQVNQALLGGLQASFDDGLFSLDLPLRKPLGELFSCSGESDQSVS
jgi:hypothetical protein